MKIQTERLTLRKFKHGDAEALYAYLHAPTATCFLSLKLESLEDAAAEVEKRGKDDEFIAVCLGSTGQLIGDLFAMVDEDTISVGWNFNPAFAGKGYALEAAKALFAHLFEQKGARRLYAYVEDHNLSSQRLCERLGMRREGTFVEFVSFTNNAAGQPIYENTMQYALLHREWTSQTNAAATLA